MGGFHMDFCGMNRGCGGGAGGSTTGCSNGPSIRNGWPECSKQRQEGYKKRETKFYGVSGFCWKGEVQELSETEEGEIQM